MRVPVRRTTARSFLSSLAINAPVSEFPEASFTVIVWHASTTWALVRISPLALITTPEPLEISAARPVATLQISKARATKWVATDVVRQRFGFHADKYVRNGALCCVWRC